MRNDRFYVIVRSDLAPGLLAAQCCHAVSVFAAAYPQEHARWKAESENIVLLSVETEGELRATAAKALLRGALVTVFTEPDLGGAATSAAVLGDVKALLRGLPLALAPARAA